MPGFGKSSRQKLDTCHPDLILIMETAIQFYDFSVLEGTRSLETQQRYYEQGKSKLDGVNTKSKHQSTPSMAIDIAPYPIKWEGEKNKARFYMLAGYIFMVSEILLAADKISHRVRWGGDWDSDKEFKDQSFDDLPHFELVPR